jgi:hypothetical protein
MKDDNRYEYLYFPSNWYINHFVHEDVNTFSIATSDVFTSGYFAKEMAKRNLHSLYKCITVFSRNHLLFLIKGDSIESNFGLENKFIINKRLNSFYIKDWGVIKSWSKIEKDLKDNQHINRIYNSGDVEIYSS